MRLRNRVPQLFCLTLLASASAMLQAQQPPQESLLIGPGDQVHVQVLDAPELEEHARVTDSGFLPLMVGDPVKIGGMTPEQAANAISTYMVNQHYLVNPRILVTVDVYATQNLSIIGEVKTPGAYPITAPKTVEEAIALGGGLADDADRNIVIQRHGTGELVTYYSANSPLTTPDSAAPGFKPAGEQVLRTRSTMVYPGDIVRVAKAAQVFAIGDFVRAGAFPIVYNDSNLTVLQLVAKAGGAAHTARLGHCRLVRHLPDGKLEDIQLSLGDMEKGKKPDEVLQANDVLYLPFSFAKNVAIGAADIVAASTTASAVAF